MLVNISDHDINASHIVTISEPSNRGILGDDGWYFRIDFLSNYNLSVYAPTKEEINIKHYNFLKQVREVL